MTCTNHSTNFAFAQTTVVEQRTVGRTSELARAALDTIHDSFFFHCFKISVFGQSSEQVRFQSHRTGTHALRATDTGLSFTDQQKADYVAGKAVKLENVTDKQGFHATMYIKFNPEKGRPYRYDTNPDNAQQVAPSNESRTQVAVNNDGKTNEATKNLREPLQKGQTNPKDARQQQQQEKPQKKTGKGMKM